MNLEEIYKNILNERTKNKKNKKDILGEKHDGINPSCGDIVQLQIIKEEKDGKSIIKDIAYIGEGCAISEASADIMCDILKGEDLESALNITELFIQMILEDEENIKVDEFGFDERYEKLGDAYALKPLRYIPQRIKCVLLAWNTAKSAIKDMLKENN